MSWLHMRKSPLSRQRERERERQGEGEVEAADGGATGGGTETANRKQKAMSIAVTNKLTGHLCLPPLSLSLHLSLHLYLLPLPASSLGLLSLLPFPCSASRTGTCSLSIYASAWTEVAGAFWNYQAKYSLRCLRISISRCKLSPPALHSYPCKSLPPVSAVMLYEELCVCSTFLPRAA